LEAQKALVQQHAKNRNQGPFAKRVWIGGFFSKQGRITGGAVYFYILWLARGTRKLRLGGTPGLGGGR